VRNATTGSIRAARRALRITGGEGDEREQRHHSQIGDRIERADPDHRMLIARAAVEGLT
jgi:hypothetical protein